MNVSEMGTFFFFHLFLEVEQADDYSNFVGGGNWNDFMYIQKLSIPWNVCVICVCARMYRSSILEPWKGK